MTLDAVEKYLTSLTASELINLKYMARRKTKEQLEDLLLEAKIRNNQAAAKCIQVTIEVKRLKELLA